MLLLLLPLLLLPLLLLQLQPPLLFPLDPMPAETLQLVRLWPVLASTSTSRAGPGGHAAHENVLVK